MDDNDIYKLLRSSARNPRSWRSSAEKTAHTPLFGLLMQFSCISNSGDCATLCGPNSRPLVFGRHGVEEGSC